MDTQQFHEKILYPVTRVRQGNGGGSGVLIYSQPDQNDPSRNVNLMLTCEHVLHGAIKVEEKWDPVLKLRRRMETFSEVGVEVFDYDGSHIVSSNSTQADIVAYDEGHDMAIVRLQNPRPMPYVSTIIPEAEIKNLRVFQENWVCGCSLLHDPFPGKGELTYLREVIDQKQYIMSSAPSIFGNCLPGDTLVSMSTGAVKPISKVEVGDRVWSVGPEAGLQHCTVLERIHSGVKPLLTIKTRTRAIRTSGNHPFLALKTAKTWAGKNMNWLDWVPAEDLTEGDVIAVLPGLPSREKGVGIRFADYIGQENDPNDLMTLLGFYLGDGWMRYREGQSYEVALATYDDGLYTKYKELITRLFKIDQFGYESSVIKVYSKALADILVALGFSGGSTVRTIPEWVMSQTPEHQLAFISGYLEADGYVDKMGSWVFEANNKDLVCKLRMMCIHLGFNISNIFERLRAPLTIAGRETAPSGPSFSFQVYPAYSKSKNTWIDGDCSALTGNLVYERISQIVTGPEEETYDLKIEGRHNFVADGVIVHNSGGGMFLGETGDLLGLTSRVTVPQLFGVPDVQPWMEFSSHPTRFYEFFREQELHFLFDPKDTYAEAMERRDKRQKEALRGLLLGQGDSAPVVPETPAEPAPNPELGAVTSIIQFSPQNLGEWAATILDRPAPTMDLSHEERIEVVMGTYGEPAAKPAFRDLRTGPYNAT